MDDPWRRALDGLLARGNGVVTRRQLQACVPKTVVDSYVGSRRLVRVFPQVYAPRGRPATGDRRLRAAVLCVGGRVALSNLTAVAVHGLRDHAGPVHVTIDHDRRHAGAPDLRVHRSRGFADRSEAVERVRGLPVTPLADGLVDSWPLLPGADRRPFLLDAVRRTRLDPRSLVAALGRRPVLPGRRHLVLTVDLIGDGVQSELEALGVLGVFRHRSLPRSVGQLAVRCRDGVTRHLDRAWEEAMLAVELDGAAFHTSPEERQRDLERDAALAAMGWLVLRFTYAEVRRDPDGVRARVLAVYRVRRAQLHGA